MHYCEWLIDLLAAFEQGISNKLFVDPVLGWILYFDQSWDVIVFIFFS